MGTIGGNQSVVPAGFALMAILDALDERPRLMGTIKDSANSKEKQLKRLLIAEIFSPLLC